MYLLSNRYKTESFLYRGRVNPAAPYPAVATTSCELFLIRVAHPGFQQASLSEFIDSIDEVVENSAEEEEQHI